MGRTCPACQKLNTDEAANCIDCGIALFSKPVVVGTVKASSKTVVGLKYDGGKLPYDLLPFSVIDSLVAVQRFGAAKYGPNNWQRIKKGKSRYIAAALRHISAVQQGQRYDEESGLPHLAHALCSLMYAEWIDQQHLRRHRCASAISKKS